MRGARGLTRAEWLLVGIGFLPLVAATVYAFTHPASFEATGVIELHPIALDRVWDPEAPQLSQADAMAKVEDEIEGPVFREALASVVPFPFDYRAEGVPERGVVRITAEAASAGPPRPAK